MIHSPDASPFAIADPQAARQLRADLEGQARELTHLLWRLERARRVLLPGPVTVWRGLTRLAFDSALTELGATMDEGIAQLRSAVDGTRAALGELGEHG